LSCVPDFRAKERDDGVRACCLVELHARVPDRLRRRGFLPGFAFKCGGIGVFRDAFLEGRRAKVLPRRRPFETAAGEPGDLAGRFKI